MRKPIQICATPETDDRSAVLYAICDDGSVWMMRGVDSTQLPMWEPLPHIPSDRYPPGKAKES
jgi:hypothetical protein